MAATGKRLLLATLGSLGDLHPMIALGRGLAARGHAVTLASSAAHAVRVAEAGLEFMPIRPDLAPGDPDLARRVLDPWRGPEVLLRELLMTSVRETWDDLAAAVRATRAQALLAGEVVYPAAAVAAEAGLPRVAVLLQPFALLSARDPPVMPNLPFARAIARGPAPLQRALLALARRHTRPWFAALDALRRERGVGGEGHPLFDGKFSAWLNLALFPPELAAAQPDWPPATVQAGFLWYDGAAPDATTRRAIGAFLDAGEPPVVFTLGSSAVYDPGWFYEDGIQAARRLGRRALLLVGAQRAGAARPGAEAAASDAGGDVAVFAYAPHSLVFPRAACIVHQGGIGTTAQALRAGRPQLVVPFAFDQPDNAARVERLGVGRAIARRRYSARRAAAALGELLGDPRFAVRATAIGQTLAREDGLARACDALEHALAGAPTPA